MHVLYLIDSLAGGGAEQSLAALTPRWVEAGVQLDVAYLHERPGVGAALEDAGARLFSLAGPGGRIGWIRRARALIRQRRPDLVHTTLFEADVAGRIAASISGVPVVSSLVSLAYGPEQLQNPGLSTWRVQGARAVDAITARRVTRFHAVTQQVADVMSNRLQISRERIEVIPRGRDPERLGVRSRDRRDLARAALGAPEEVVLVLAAARHEYQKGLDILLQAIPPLLRVAPSVQLVVAGRRGNQTQVLRATAERLGLNETVHFLGHREDVPDLLCAADVFVAPSRWEGLPGTVLEAMALEVPIVASDIPPIREIAPNGEAALLIRPGQPEALARAIATVLEDNGTARTRSIRGRARFLEKYTIDQIAHRMLEFYYRALGGNRGRS